MNLYLYVCVCRKNNKQNRFLAKNNKFCKIEYNVSTSNKYESIHKSGCRYVDYRSRIPLRQKYLLEKNLQYESTSNTGVTHTHYVSTYTTYVSIL